MAVVQDSDFFQRGFPKTMIGVTGFDETLYVRSQKDEIPPVSVRSNIGKKAVDNIGINDNLDMLAKGQVPWCPNGHYLKLRPSFTLDPSFHAGGYYVQEASSMFLWQVLVFLFGHQPSAGKTILDLCAAPGGKSTLLSDFFKQGLVVCNETIKQRSETLVENLIKWGSGNTIATSNDAARFASLGPSFDLVLVDAPCSGSGMFRKDPAAIAYWSKDLVKQCAQRQKRILADVLPSLKPGGYMVYSTCSFSQEENEDILDFLANEHGLVGVTIDVSKHWGIVESVSEGKGMPGYRFYPYLLKGEGLFMAVLQKAEDARWSAPKYSLRNSGIGGVNGKELDRLHGTVGKMPGMFFFKHGNGILALDNMFVPMLEMLQGLLYIKKAGTSIGETKGDGFVPHHDYALSVLDKQGFSVLALEKIEALKYLKRESFVHDAKSIGWHLVSYGGLGLGWAKLLQNRVNNYYPMEWRVLKEIKE